MYCESCGAALIEDSNYCDSCGASTDLAAASSFTSSVHSSRQQASILR
jgi:uncharacterized OB-fold protein